MPEDQVKQIKETLPKEQKQITGDAPTVGEWRFLKYVVYGLTIVIGLAMIGLILQYMTATQATFQSLNNQIVSQNAKIELLYQECVNK